MHIPFQVFDNTLTSMHAALQFLVINGAGEVDKKKKDISTSISREEKREG